MRFSLGFSVFSPPRQPRPSFYSFSTSFSIPDHPSCFAITSHFASPSFFPSAFIFLFLLIIDYPTTVCSLFLSPSSSLPRSTDRCFVIIPSRRHMRIQILGFQHAYFLEGVRILEGLQTLSKSSRIALRAAVELERIGIPAVRWVGISGDPACSASPVTYGSYYERVSPHLVHVGVWDNSSQKVAVQLTSLGALLAILVHRQFLQLV